MKDNLFTKADFVKLKNIIIYLILDLVRTHFTLTLLYRDLAPIKIEANFNYLLLSNPPE